LRPPEGVVAFDVTGPVGRYWLAHAEGFTIVDAAGTPRGVVDEVVADGLDERVTRLVVRTGAGGLLARRSELDPRTLTQVVPAERVFVARGAAVAPAPPEPRPPARDRLVAAVAAVQRADARLGALVQAAFGTVLAFGRRSAALATRAAGAAATGLRHDYARGRPLVLRAARTLARALHALAADAADAARRTGRASRPALSAAAEVARRAGRASGPAIAAAATRVSESVAVRRPPADADAALARDPGSHAEAPTAERH
jgi:hypothetical protein